MPGSRALQPGLADPEALFASAPVGIVRCDLDRRILAINPKARELYRIEQSDLGSFLPIPPTEEKRWREVRDRLIQGEVIENLQVTRYHPDGSMFCALISAVPERNDSGHVVAFLGVVSDVTNLMRTQEALARTAGRLRIAQQASGVGLYMFDFVQNCSEVDEHWRRIYGWPAEGPGPTHQQWVAMIHPLDRHRVLTTLDAVAESRADFVDDLRILRPNGVAHELRWVHVAARREYGPDGSPIRSIGAAMDITSRKVAEEELRSSEELFRTLAQASPVGIFQADLEGNLLYANPFVERVWGISTTECLGRKWLSLIHPDDVSKLLAGWLAANQTGEPYEQDFRLITPAGDLRYVHGRCAVWYNRQGKPGGSVITVDDITSRRQAEEALRNSEKLAVVGRLASSIAHEINNPLEAVFNLLYLAQCSADAKDVKAHIEAAQEQLARVGSIVTHTLSFNRRPTHEGPVDLPVALDSVLILLQGRLRSSDINLDRRYHNRSSPIITGFENELRQLFTNLIGNAIDAMHGSPRRCLMLRVYDTVHARTGQPGVRITIGDTGTGMTADTISHLFQPFFSTKGIRGTGLGLWASKDIIDKHKATIAIRSTVNRGSVFRIFFPGSTEPPPAEEPTTSQSIS